MNQVNWITVKEAADILECTRANVHRLLQNGNIRRKETVQNKRLVYCRLSDVIAYLESSAWRSSKSRRVGGPNKGMRAKKDMPEIDSDIEALVQAWKGSKDQKVYAKRYSIGRKRRE